MQKHIELTPLDSSHIAEVHSLWSDEDATRFTNFPYIPDLKGCRARLTKMLEFYRKNPAHFGPFCLRTADGTFLGLAGADANADLAGHYEIWYFVKRHYWRRGIATAAVRTLLEMLTASGQARAIVAEAAVANGASWKLLEALGFRREKLIHAPDGAEKTFDRYLYVAA